MANQHCRLGTADMRKYQRTLVSQVDWGLIIITCCNWQIPATTCIYLFRWRPEFITIWCIVKMKLHTLRKSSHTSETKTWVHKIILILIHNKNSWMQSVCSNRHVQNIESEQNNMSWSCLGMRWIIIIWVYLLGTAGRLVSIYAER